MFFPPNQLSQNENFTESISMNYTNNQQADKYIFCQLIQLISCLSISLVLDGCITPLYTRTFDSDRNQYKC